MILGKIKSRIMKKTILILSLSFLFSCGDDDSATGQTHDKDEKQFYGFYKLN